MKEKYNKHADFYKIKWSEVFKCISIFVGVVGLIFIINSTIKGHNIPGSTDYTLVYLFVSTIIVAAIFILFFGMYKAFVCIEGMQKQLKSMSREFEEKVVKSNTADYWWCICGKRNAGYIGTCACGKRKPR